MGRDVTQILQSGENVCVLFQKDDPVPPDWFEVVSDVSVLVTFHSPCVATLRDDCFYIRSFIDDRSFVKIEAIEESDSIIFTPMVNAVFESRNHRMWWYLEEEGTYDDITL